MKLPGRALSPGKATGALPVTMPVAKLAAYAPVIALGIILGTISGLACSYLFF